MLNFDFDYVGAMALATCELIWLKQLIKELKLCEPGKMKLIWDNQVALHIASKPIFQERTKHIEISCHFVREKKKQRGEVVTAFVNSNNQLLDIVVTSLRGLRYRSYVINLVHIIYMHKLEGKCWN